MTLPQLVQPAWLHTLDPYVFEIAPGLGLRWYGTAYLAGFVAAWLILRGMAKRRLVAFAPDRAFDVIITLAIAALVGGRLGYAVFYDPPLLWTFTAKLPFWDLLALNKGGMASHGGIIGGIAACWYISRGQKTDSGQRVGACPFMHVTDTMALIATPGLCFGRLANFINGELLGKIVAMPGQPAPWWAVKFPQEVLTNQAPELTPEQHDKLAELIANTAPNAPDYYTGYETVLHRLQSGSAEVARQLEPLISARHPSQLYQAAVEGLVVGAAVWLVARKPRKPGVVGATFLMVYGIGRIATEIYRLPDAHLHVQRIFGLSRGQWLSVLMVAAGIAILIWAKRSQPKKLYFGWAGSSSR